LSIRSGTFTSAPPAPPGARASRAEAAREAIIVAAERDPRRRVVVRTRPGNDAAQLLASRIGLARAPELDADGFVTFVSRGPSPRFQLRTRLLAGTAEGRALRG
jgi:hypothetical protein